MVVASVGRLRTEVFKQVVEAVIDLLREASGISQER